MIWLWAIVAILVTLFLVVGIHEAGHAITAKWFHVKIRKVSIGFGKALLSFRDKAGREWIWSLWPLGGYALLLNSRIEPVPESDYKHCFDKKPIWQRCIILMAGSLANLLCAIAALTLMFMLGYQRQIPIIETVSPQSIAAKAGLKDKDRFLSLAGQPTDSWTDLGMVLLMKIGKTQVPAIIQDKEGKISQIYLDLSRWTYSRKDHSLLASFGIKAIPHQEKVLAQTFFPALSSALSKIGFLLKFFIILIKQLLTRELPFSILLGPFSFFEVSIHSFNQGLASFLYFIGSLSLAVGLVSLFPIPSLDGASIVYALVEKGRGKPLSIAFEVLLYRLALIILGLLLIQLILNDLKNFMRF